MADLILSSSHYHRHIAIYVVQVLNTILGRGVSVLRDLHFTLLYVVVSINTYISDKLSKCKYSQHMYTFAQTG